MIEKLPLPQKEYMKIYSKVPRPAVDLIIKTKNGIVLVKRGENDLGPGKGKWHLPGKTIFYGETVKQAIERTAKNETGLKVKVRKFLGYKEYRIGVTFGFPLSLVFLAEAVSGKLHDSEGREINVFKKLPKNIGFGHRELLKRAGYK